LRVVNKPSENKNRQKQSCIKAATKKQIYVKEKQKQIEHGSLAKSNSVRHLDSVVVGVKPEL
jgi:hypothetical protein